MEPLYIIALFLVAGAASSSFMLMAFKKRRLKYEALRDFAHTKSWDIAFKAGDGLSNDATTLFDPNDSWQFVSSSTHSSGSVTRWYEWRSDLGKLEEGFAMLGPQLPDRTVEMMNKGAAGPLTKAIKLSLYQFTHHLAVNIDSCKLVNPQMGDGIGTVLATPGNENQLDAFLTLPELSQARAGKKSMQQPVIYRDSQGVRIRTQGDLKSTAEVEQIVDLGLAMRQCLNKS